MIEDIDNEYFDEEINLIPYIKKILAHWKKILFWALLAGVLAFVFCKTLPKEFTVTSKISPELSYRSNSLSSLASLAGINLNTLSNTDALLPTVYPDVVNSIPFMTGLFDVPVEFEHKKEKIDTTLYAYLKDYSKANWVSVVLNSPFILMGKIKELFEEKEEVEEEVFEVDPYRLTKDQYAIAKALCNNVVITTDKRTFLITLKVTMQDPEIAALVSRKVIDMLQGYVIGYRTNKAKEDLAYTESMLEDARAEYYEAQQNYARYLDSNQGFVFQSAMVEQQRLQNDVNLKYQLYNSLAQRVQQCEAQVQQETPVFAEILPPTVPLRKSKPSTMKTTLLFMMLAAIASSIVILKKSKDSEVNLPS